MPGNEILGPLEQQRALIERTRENTARLARAYATHQTTGWGEITVDKPVLFGCTFIEKPIVVSGIEIISSTAGNEAEPIDGRYPRVTAGVWRWVLDIHGYYTGAYLWFAIETMGFQATGGTYAAGSDPAYVISHNFIFEGVSYKDFNIQNLDL